jgi:hypothetical protein
MLQDEDATKNMCIAEENSIPSVMNTPLYSHQSLQMTTVPRNRSRHSLHYWETKRKSYKPMQYYIVASNTAPPITHVQGYTAFIILSPHTSHGCEEMKQNGNGSDGDAVGDAPGCDAAVLVVGDVGEEQRVGEHGRAVAVLEPGVRVHGLHALLDLGQPRAEPLERLLRPGVRRPLRRVALAEVHLVGGVAGQDLQQRDADDGLELAGDGAHEEPLRVALQLCVRLGARHRHGPPAHRRPVRVVPAVGVLAEVDGCVQRRRDPDDGGAGPGELRHRLHLGPPGLVLEVGVPDLARLLPPRLQLDVGLQDAVVGVVDGQVLRHPLLDGVPDGQPVGRVRVVLQQQPHLVRARRVLHGHASAIAIGLGSWHGAD